MGKYCLSFYYRQMRGGGKGDHKQNKSAKPVKIDEKLFVDGRSFKIKIILAS